MFTYSQRLVGPNSCSYVAILTNLSNLIGKQLNVHDMNIGYNQVWSNGRGALVNTTTINRVLDWFNKYYKKNITLEMSTITGALNRIKKGEMGYIGFRWNRESAYDFQIDGVINQCPKGQMEGGHSCNLIYRDNKFVLIDNYKLERQHNEYIVSEEILNEMIKNKIIRGTCYFFR